jgi:hypothetical protein
VREFPSEIELRLSIWVGQKKIAQLFARSLLVIF